MYPNLNSDLLNIIKYENFEFNTSFSAGTIGTRANQYIVDLTELDWTASSRILGVTIMHIENSSTLIPLAFISADKLYLNVYRATSSGVSSNTIRVRILYVPQKYTG